MLTQYLPLLASPEPFLKSAKLLLSCCPQIFQGLMTLRGLLLEAIRMTQGLMMLHWLLLEVIRVTPGQRPLAVVVAVDAWMVELR